MIEKKRLEELIEQRAKIWGIGKSNNVFCVGLKFRDIALKNKEWLNNKLEVYSKFFETKEEAEWHKEFGCIERTERLELPTWEEIPNEVYIVKFLSKDRIEYSLMQFNSRQGWILFNEMEKKIVEKFFNRTKENYTLACRKCKELFLGQKDE